VTEWAQFLTPGDNPDYIQARNQVIQHACAKMLEIRNAAANGLAWSFEDEDLILGSEIVDRGVPGVSPLLDQRAGMLAEAINSLAQLITALADGSFQVRYITDQPNLDLVGYISDLQLQLGLPEAGDLPWTRQETGAMLNTRIHDYLSYISWSPQSTTALPPSTIPWWASAEPEACSPQAGATEEQAAIVRNTPFWVHIPDIVGQPQRADWLDRDFPRSNTGLQTPPTGTTQITGQGDSYPLMREGDRYFYLLNGQRIYLPGLQQQFPQLAE
jgi:hypothetical protein